MTWDALLESLRGAGLPAIEEDFMEEYGPVVTEAPQALKGRHFRYTFGAARIGPLRFEAYTFASETEATEFNGALGESPAWYRRANIVFHTAPEEMRQLIDLLENTLRTG